VIPVSTPLFSCVVDMTVTGTLEVKICQFI